jgi:uncharacterized protein DUF5946
MMFKDDELRSELGFYTLAHGDPAFIHQLVVDAYAAQNADDSAKPIGVVFALIGLYLHLEKGYTGKQVQRAHMHLARHSKTWPRLPVPTERGAVRINDVLAAEPGPERDAMIERWCASVWQSWKDSHAAIATIGREHLGIN